MSRNLTTSSCCGNVVRLADLRDRPIEFRRYRDDPPSIGTRWDCPDCATAYFVIWRDAVWDYRGAGFGNGWARGFVLDLSYYDTFNDEVDADRRTDPRPVPAHLCEDDADDAQEVW